jgi:thiol-disulfide isomerase/thioredoxin
MPDSRGKVNNPPGPFFAFESPASAFIFSVMKHAILALLLGILPLQASDLWSTNYEESLKKAAAENRMVLLEFTGSDWCPPCKKQAEDVFAQPAFEEFASANLVPVKLDFPRRAAQSEEQKAANHALAKQYQVDGFPTVILLDSKGTELAREVGYGGGGVTAFIEWVNKNKK